MKPVKSHIIGVGSTRLDVVGEAKIVINTPTRSLSHDVWILKDLGMDGILGMDLWTAAGHSCLISNETG